MNEEALGSEWRGMLTAAAMAIGGAMALGFAGRWFFWFDLLSHPRLYLAAALGVIAIMLLFSGAPKRGVVAAITALIGFGSIAHATLSVGNSNGSTLSDLKVLSFNVLAWNQSSDEAAKLIIESRAEVAIIMEAPGIYDHLEDLRGAYRYSSGCVTARACDLLLLSRYPIEEIKRPRLWGGRDRIAIARINTGKHTVSVAGIHLSKPYYDGVHWNEMRDFGRQIESVSGPLIVAGDFNQSPWSAHLRTFASQNGLAFVPGYRPSWPAGMGLAGIPIDHMFTKGGVNVISATRLEDSAGSNHSPLFASFDLP